MEKQPKIVYILAHPDDESFIVSGSIAKYSDKGVKVIYICATRGENGHGGGLKYQLPSDELKMIRIEELEKVCDLLGIDELYELDYPDGHLHELESSEPINRLVTYLRREKPDVVITFDSTGISGHLDHVTTHKWVTQAFHLSSNPFYWSNDLPPYTPAKLYNLTVPAHHLVSILNSEEKEEEIDSKITTVINVKDYLEIKKAAIECHKSQCNNIKRIFKFAGGKDELEDHEYYILADCNIPHYSYEVMENDLLSGISH